jgi:predicted phage terminase large subunit-like protein
VESGAFARLFPGLTTRSDSRAVEYWELDGHRGSMLAVGVGGPITGHGARLGIIDDPLENWEQAQSQTIRDKLWEWWRCVFRTRLWQGGAIVLIMSRWHEDDLAGRLLAEQAGQWEILRLPAVAETQVERDANNARLGLPAGQSDPLGRQAEEPLCPERFSLEALHDLQHDVGSIGWAGQYQGTPRAAEGNRFKRAWFPVVEAAPVQGQRVRYWDKAATAGRGAYTAGVLMVRGPDRLYYVEHVVRGRWSSGQRDQIMKQTAQLDRAKYGNRVHIWVEQEPGSGGKESAEASVRLLVGYPVRVERVTDPKEVRCEPFAAQCEAGNVRLVRGPWNGAYIDELTSFPNGSCKDQVDASAGAFNKLACGYAGPTIRPMVITPGPDCSNPYRFPPI